MSQRFTVNQNYLLTTVPTGASAELISVFDNIPLAAPRVTFGGPAAPSKILGVEVQAYLVDGGGAIYAGLELVSLRIAPHINGTRLPAPTFQTIFNVSTVTTIQGVVTNGQPNFVSPIPAGQGIYLEELIVRMEPFTPAPPVQRIVVFYTFVCE